MGPENMDWSKSEDIIQLLNAVRSDQENRSLTPTFSNIMWSTILSAYQCFHYPMAWCKFFYNNLLAQVKPPPKCAVYGEFVDHNKMTIARPIPLSQFKAVAKANSGTVNDLFMSIALRSLKRYAEKMQCETFQSGAINKCFKCGIASYRPMDTKGFAKELVQYATEGTNANKLDCVPFRVNLQQTDVSSIQSQFHSFKYGALRPQARHLFSILNAIPGGRRAQVEACKAIVLCTSNVRGPLRPIPIPMRAKVDGQDDGSYEIVDQAKDDKGSAEGRDGFTPIFFGMAVPVFFPINYTLISYNDYCRVGLITNSGSVEDPETLMQCFVDEWNEYNVNK